MQWVGFLGCFVTVSFDILSLFLVQKYLTSAAIIKKYYLLLLEIISGEMKY